ncbi:MAG: sulfurtransferase TusE [Gammaproteobacteria bacterium]|jgi:tRNA 2-thiouridine synthesizing protein E|nr:sulfurtransferase TusE [Pseudohongiella sp.]MAY56439.1 sulfurtransferase TusE [Gammaproteobacteria bacterium]|tara:strand:- start:2253 stop:2591 length:339 start_codon:yes stop_codon:yes gene_type:complete
MNALSLPDGRRIPLDKDGYLRSLDDWSIEVAGTLANNENISLTDAHWEIIHLVQQFYEETGLAPATRALVRLVAQRAGPDKGRSIYLMKLFGGKPALTVSKLAGLPRPANCF